MKNRVFEKITKKSASLADAKKKLELVRAELERHKRFKGSYSEGVEVELDGNYIVLVTRDIYELLSDGDFFFSIFDGVPVEVIPGVSQVFIGKEVV